jgi:hypothetical protein
MRVFKTFARPHSQHRIITCILLAAVVSVCLCVPFRFIWKLGRAVETRIFSLQLALREKSLERAVKHQEDRQGFFLVTWNKTEELTPALGACGITVYADLVYKVLEEHPERVATVEKAALLVFPPYLAWETNWPVYQGQKNMLREGGECAYLAYETAQALIRVVNAINLTHRSHHPLKLLVLDSYPYYSHLPNEAHSNSYFIWAKLNMLESYARRQDISMPPPLPPSSLPGLAHNLVPKKNSEPRGGIKNGTPSEIQQAQKGKRRRKYFLTFLGNFQSHPVRSRFGQMLHDPSEGVIVEDSHSMGAALYDYNDLLVNTSFTLVLRGDKEFSYRFTEAVCSGSVPVLVSDGWIVPYSQHLVPFQEYGVQVSEDAEAGAVLSTLHALIDEEGRWEAMQEKALHVCKSSMVSVQKSTEAMLFIALHTADD